MGSIALVSLLAFRLDKWANIGVINKTLFYIIMMTSSNENIFRVTGLFCGEFTGPRQWSGALMFSFICVWINGWVHNREAGDLRGYRAHYDVTVMMILLIKQKYTHGPTEAYNFAVAAGNAGVMQSKCNRCKHGLIRRISHISRSNITSYCTHPCNNTCNIELTKEVPFVSNWEKFEHAVTWLDCWAWFDCIYLPSMDK